VFKFSEPGYYITTATSAEQYCLSHIKKIIADAKLDCEVDNITEQRAIISIQGPKRLVMKIKLIKRNNDLLISDCLFIMVPVVNTFLLLV